MGNRFIRMRKKDERDEGSGSKRMNRSQRKSMADEESLHRQVLSKVLHQHQLSQRFEGSMSRRIGSTSTRKPNLSDPSSNDKQGTVQVPVLSESIETKTILLIHGEGFGAWCWYKTIALLEEAGLRPVAFDLTASGIDLTDTNSVSTLAEYSRPLNNYLTTLPEDEKVILVGHSGGGACVCYALEHFPQKIAKAVFLCATMVLDGQRPFDVIAEELGSVDEFMKESKYLVHGNGEDKLPTGLMFDKEQMKGLYFNQSPAKDVALAMVSMRAIAVGPMMERMRLSHEGYGRSRRYYVQALDDRAICADVQEKLVRQNPPERVFKIKGSDHCPFFSKPQSLHKILLEIALIP